MLNHTSSPLVEIAQLETSDGATTDVVLHTNESSDTVAVIIHPRSDVTYHPLVDVLLARGISVMTQRTRSSGTDFALIHEQAIIDLAAGLGFLRLRGFSKIVGVGHSGGAPLIAFYNQQAGLDPRERVMATPSGEPSKLDVCKMSTFDAVAFIGPHPGQGKILETCIDPAVLEESDPLSVDSSADMFDERNGFVAAPGISKYGEAFLTEYRHRQKERIHRIDEAALKCVSVRTDARERFRETASNAWRRKSVSPGLVVIYRTDADPRTVDLSIDPSERPYGSVWGRRPDISNYGVAGFARCMTIDAWLSTWSANLSNASFEKCGAGTTIPTLVVAYTGDQLGFPKVTERIFASIGTNEKTFLHVRGSHFGAPLSREEPPGYVLAGNALIDWLN